MKAEARDVGLAGIAVLPDRMRKLRTEKVEELAASMKDNGLLQPIVVRPREGVGTGYYLIAGRHRLEAAKLLKWPGIPCRVLEGIDADQALMAEIDENLMRAELSPAEAAAHQKARKEVYLRLHPKTKQGGAPGKAGGGKKKREERQVVVLRVNDVHTEDEYVPYVEDAAKKTGKDRRTVEREVKRGTDVPNVAALAGTSLDKGEELDALGKLRSLNKEAADELAERAKAGEKVSARTEVKKVERAQKEVNLAAVQTALPDKKYGVILADPEWRFEPYSRETGMDRAADNHYPTSSTDTIGSRDVESIAADDCVLFLWATVPMLLDAINVMEMWGFKYKSHAVWVKDRQGTGYWFRNKHELLLVGTRGNIPAPAPGTQWESVIEAPAGRHSEKPQDAYDMIEAYFPNLPKIELNARSRRAGWEAWGNEAEVVAA